MGFHGAPARPCTSAASAPSRLKWSQGSTMLPLVLTSSCLQHRESAPEKGSVCRPCRRRRWPKQPAACRTILELVNTLADVIHRERGIERGFVVKRMMPLGEGAHPESNQQSITKGSRCMGSPESEISVKPSTTGGGGPRRPAGWVLKPSRHGLGHLVLEFSDGTDAFHVAAFRAPHGERWPQ